MKRKSIRLLALAALTLAVIGPWVTSSQTAWAYSCSVCYGTINWTGNVDGAFASIVTLPSLSAGDGKANIELWLNAPVPGGQTCPINGTQYAGCWVELGAKAGGPQCKTNVPCYFWNDLRPCNACYNNYYTHYISDIPGSDYNNQTDLRIERSSGSSFAMSLQSRNLQWSDSSTGNSMYPNDIEIGAEVAGTSGAHIGSTSFRNNSWKPVGANYYNFQTANGNPTVNSPVSAYWSTTPSTPNSTGGTWSLSCPC